MTDIIDCIQFPGKHIVVAGFSSGASVTEEYPAVSMKAYYTRLPCDGDFVQAQPYTHGRYKTFGIALSQMYKYNPYGPNRGWIYDGYRKLPYPMPIQFPGIGIMVNGAIRVIGPSSARSRVDNRLLKKLADKKYSLGESLGELTEGVSFVCGKAARLVRVLQDLKHGRFSNALKELGVRKSYLSNTWEGRWLEAQFAIAPLIGEVDQALRLVNKGLQARQFLHCRTHTREHVELDGFVDQYYGYKGTLTWTVRASMTAEIDLGAMRAAMQLGLGNPVSIMWELLPLSWLVDYVTNVGDLLEMFGATYGATFVTGCYSELAEGDVNILPNATRAHQDGWDKEITTYSGGASVEAFTRTVMADFPLPHAMVRFPCDLNKIANTIALIRAFTR